LRRTRFGTFVNESLEGMVKTKLQLLALRK
jgi:hypothetical protein